MQNTMAVAKREFASYFNSTLAYIFVAIYLGVSGYLFFTELFIGGQAELRQFFGLMPLLLCILIPFLTMRLLAEERREGTLELLLTMPVSDLQLVLGKFLACLGLVAVMLLLTLPFAVSVASIGPIDKGATVAAYLGALLMAGGYVAIGLMVSAFTNNVIVAALVAFVINFTLFLIGNFAQVMPTWLAGFANAISTTSHFQNIARGVVDTRDLLYYASLIFVCLLVAQTTLESRRWR